MTKKRIRTMLLPAIFLTLFVLGCDAPYSNGVIILLPGLVKETPLVLLRASATDVSINGDYVPTLIVKVWWNDEVIITQNHPTTPRNKFPGDTYRRPDRTRFCWYVIHPKTESVKRFDSHDAMERYIKTLGVDPAKVELLSLHKAQRLREKQLGFTFTPQSINRFLRSAGPDIAGRYRERGTSMKP